MSSFEELIDDEPPVIDPYEELGLDKSATADQVKSAYRKAALKHHPDKVSEDQKAEAHTKFQSIAFAYAILSDPDRRKRYDTTGSTSDSIIDSDCFDWTEYYREQFANAISSGAIEKIAAEYKNSDEEKKDILAAYQKAHGKMGRVYSSVMLSNVLEDDERFRAIIDAAIAAGDVKGYSAYTKETEKSKQQRIKQARSEAKEAEEYAKELGVHDMLFCGGAKKTKGGKGKKAEDNDSALKALIIKRQVGRGASFLDHLEEKYCGSAKAKRGKKRPAADEAEEAEEDEDDMPSEEAFQAAAARLKQKSKVGADKAPSAKPSKKARRK